MTVFANDVLEASARCEFEGVEDVINVYQWEYQGPAAALDADVISDVGIHLEVLYGPFVGAQSTSFIYRDITLRNVTQGTLMGVFGWPTLTAGSSAADNLPPGVSAVVNFATAIARVILRKYLGGWIVSLLDTDGTFNTTLTGLLITYAALVMGGFSISGRAYAYGHLSAKTLGFEHPTSATVTDIPGYQRRRKQGRGS